MVIPDGADPTPAMRTVSWVGTCEECDVAHDRLSQVLQAEERPPTTVLLPSSVRSVAVPIVLRRESRWAGEVPQSFRVVPNKPALAYGDRFLYPEFFLLRLLEQAGWSGVWVKNWGGRAFWTDISTPIDLPPGQREVFELLEQRMGKCRGGRWDIFAWRESEILFVESKKQFEDCIRPTQAMWLEQALEHGVPLSSFLIAEYVIDRGPA